MGPVQHSPVKGKGPRSVYGRDQGVGGSQDGCLDAPPATSQDKGKQPDPSSGKSADSDVLNQILEQGNRTGQQVQEIAQQGATTSQQVQELVLQVEGLSKALSQSSRAQHHEVVELRGRCAQLERQLFEALEQQDLAQHQAIWLLRQLHVVLRDVRCGPNDDPVGVFVRALEQAGAQGVQVKWVTKGLQRQQTAGGAAEQRYELRAELASPDDVPLAFRSKRQLQREGMLLANQLTPMELENKRQLQRLPVFRQALDQELRKGPAAKILWQLDFCYIGAGRDATVWFLRRAQRLQAEADAEGREEGEVSGDNGQPAAAADEEEQQAACRQEEQHATGGKEEQRTAGRGEEQRAAGSRARQQVVAGREGTGATQAATGRQLPGPPADGVFTGTRGQKAAAASTSYVAAVSAREQAPPRPGSEAQSRGLLASNGSNTRGNGQGGRDAGGGGRDGDGGGRGGGGGAR